MKKIKLKYLLIFTPFLLFSDCHTEGVKLERDDRILIDTLVARRIAVLSVEMDEWCKDSSPILRQKMVDSLMIVREQEILKGTPPPQY